MYPSLIPLRYFPVSKLEIISCDFTAENNFVNLLIPFIGIKELKHSPPRLTEGLFFMKPSYQNKLLSKLQIIKYDGFVKR